MFYSHHYVSYQINNKLKTFIFSDLFFCFVFYKCLLLIAGINLQRDRCRLSHTAVCVCTLCTVDMWHGENGREQKEMQTDVVENKDNTQMLW